MEVEGWRRERRERRGGELFFVTYTVHVCGYLFVFPAAVTSLAKFGASCDDLLESIVVLLDRSVVH